MIYVAIGFGQIAVILLALGIVKAVELIWENPYGPIRPRQDR